MEDEVEGSKGENRGENRGQPIEKKYGNLLKVNIYHVNK